MNSDKRFWRGETGMRLASKRCSKCGASGFTYSNGYEFSVDGVRGYRCPTCGTIKPEADTPSLPQPQNTEGV